MDDLEIRRATPSDKQAVLDISGGIYDGLDYLEDKYDTVFMNDPNITSYVGVYKGEIAAFMAAHVVDGGATVISRAARVKQSLSGRGIYKRLKQHCDMNSGASQNAFTAGNINPALNTGSFQEQFTLVLKRSFTRYDFNAQRLKQICENDVNTNSLKLLTESLLLQYFTDTEHKHYLFPKERILSHWVPYKLLESNVPLILNEDSRTLRLTDVRSQGADVQGLLTMSTIYTGANGASVCSIDIYGKYDASMICHLASQLKFLCENSRENNILLVVTEPTFDMLLLEKAFEELSGLSKTIWRSPTAPETLFNTGCLFERPVKADE